MHTDFSNDKAIPIKRLMRLCSQISPSPQFAAHKPRHIFNGIKRLFATLLRLFISALQRESRIMRVIKTSPPIPPCQFRQQSQKGEGSRLLCFCCCDKLPWQSNINGTKEVLTQLRTQNPLSMKQQQEHLRYWPLTIILAENTRCCQSPAPVYQSPYSYPQALHSDY